MRQFLAGLLCGAFLASNVPGWAIAFLIAAWWISRETLRIVRKEMGAKRLELKPDDSFVNGRYYTPDVLADWRRN